ncbi:MAG: competence protein TfoX [Clostridia bacterium]|nr:competence protein TfoX [Clostridia bacterium]
MASSKAYLAFVLDQLSGLEGIVCKPMMGEYLFSLRGRTVAGIYDDRFLVKDTPAARKRMPEAPLVSPYPGARQMLLVEEIDDRAFLAELLAETAAELPDPPAKKTKRKGKTLL